MVPDFLQHIYGHAKFVLKHVTMSTLAFDKKGVNTDLLPYVSISIV